MSASELTGPRAGRKEWIALGVLALPLLLVNIYVRGTGALTVGAPKGTQQVSETNQLYGRRLMMLATPDRFPTIAATIEAGILRADADDDPDDFYFGLSAILDGIQALIDRSAARA